MCFLLSRLLGKNGELLGSYGCFCIVVTKATHKTKPTTCLCELHRIGCAWHSHDQPPQSFTHFNFDFRRHHLNLSRQWAGIVAIGPFGFKEKVLPLN